MRCVAEMSRGKLVRLAENLDVVLAKEGHSRASGNPASLIFYGLKSPDPHLREEDGLKHSVPQRISILIWSVLIWVLVVLVADLGVKEGQRML